MLDPWPEPPPGADAWPCVYAILISDFRGEGTAADGAPVTIGFAARLIADHPGPQFADDIRSVASYEIFVEILRCLCAERKTAAAATLADRAARRLAACASIRWAGVRCRVQSLKNTENLDMADAECFAPASGWPDET